MNWEATRDIILIQLRDWGTVLFSVVSAIIVIALGVLIFEVGLGYLRNMPGDIGYNPRKGSGLSRFRNGKRNSSGGANLLE